MGMGWSETVWAGSGLYGIGWKLGLKHASTGPWRGEWGVVG